MTHTLGAELSTILSGGAIGVAIGLLLAAGVAWRLGVAHARRVRSAERRALRAERMAEIGAMTAGLAHEIKNPLSTIGLNAQLLSEGLDDLPAPGEDKSRLVRRVETLRREVERLRGILTDFLEYAGEIRLAPTRTDLNAVVEELVDFFLPQAEQQGVRLRMEPAPGRLEADLDVPLVKQAILNLMLNAVQAMGQVRDSGAPRELILRTERGTDEERRPTAAVHVIDTGPGIPPDIASRIFEPYFTTKAGGSGLGLPTARRLVEAHGGRLELHSEPGVGTDFTMTFRAPE